MKFKNLLTDLSPLLAATAFVLCVSAFGCTPRTASTFDPGKQVTAVELDAEIAAAEAEFVASASSAESNYKAAIQAAEFELEAALGKIELDKATLAALADARYSELDRKIQLQQRVIGIAEPIVKSAAATQGVPPGTTDALWNIVVGGLGFGGVGSAGLMLWRKRNSDRALGEVVTGVQKLRSDSLVADKAEIDVVLKKYQSPATEAAVTQIKAA